VSFYNLEAMQKIFYKSQNDNLYYVHFISILCPFYVCSFLQLLPLNNIKNIQYINTLYIIFQKCSRTGNKRFGILKVNVFLWKSYKLLRTFFIQCRQSALCLHTSLGSKFIVYRSLKFIGEYFAGHK